MGQDTEEKDVGTQLLCPEAVDTTMQQEKAVWQWSSLS